jgi:hypothetical protein
MSMAAGKQQQPLSERGRFWRGHLQRWGQSGLSQAEYCRQQQLSAAALGWWKGRLSRTQVGPGPASILAPREGRRGSFVELTVGGGTRVSPGEVYEIVLSEGRQLRLGSHFEPLRVRQLLALLEERC